MSKKPKCVSCPTCGAPAVKRSTISRHYTVSPSVVCDVTEHVDLLTPLKDLVRCIRDFQLGDYSPLMDEIFDAEHAIRMAEKKPKKGLDYE